MKALRPRSTTRPSCQAKRSGPRRMSPRQSSAVAAAAGGGEEQPGLEIEFEDRVHAVPHEHDVGAGGDREGEGEHADGDALRGRQAAVDGDEERQHGEDREAEAERALQAERQHGLDGRDRSHPTREHGEADDPHRDPAGAAERLVRRPQRPPPQREHERDADEQEQPEDVGEVPGVGERLILEPEVARRRAEVAPERQEEHVREADEDAGEHRRPGQQQEHEQRHGAGQRHREQALGGGIADALDEPRRRMRHQRVPDDDGDRGDDDEPQHQSSPDAEVRLGQRRAAEQEREEEDVGRRAPAVGHHDGAEQEAEEHEDRERADGRRRVDAPHPPHRQREEAEGERHHQHVRVQVGEQEAPEGILVDGVLDDARRRPEVVEVDGLAAHQLAQAGEVADQDDEDRAQDPDAAPAADRRAERKRGARGERAEQRDAEVEDQAGVDVAELAERRDDVMAEVGVVQRRAGEPRLGRRQGRRA